MGKNNTYEDEKKDSSESLDGNNEMCPHFMRSVNIMKIRKQLNQISKNICNLCEDNENSKDSEDSTLKTCLSCGHVACGENKENHAEKHFNNANHCIAIDNSKTQNIICYKCNHFVDNRKGNNFKIAQEVRNILQKPTEITQKTPIPLCQNVKSFTENEKKYVKDLPKVRGLANLGNTCFFNAVLQCLAQTPYLTKVLDDLKEPRKFVLPGGKIKINGEEVEYPRMEETLKNDSFLDFTRVLLKTLTEMHITNSATYRPSDLMNFLREKKSSCANGGQHDSHEMLRQLLEFVRNEDDKRYKAVILEKCGYAKEKANDKKFVDQIKFYGNQANMRFLGPDRVFRGELVSTLQCRECGHSSSRTEPFLDLSLPVLLDKPITPISKSWTLDKSFDSIDKKYSKSLTKKEMKNLRKSYNRKNEINRLKNLENNFSEKTKGNAESEESDADVEDNIENEHSSTSLQNYDSMEINKNSSDINFSLEQTDNQVTVSLEHIDTAEIAITGSSDVNKNAENCDNQTIINPLNNLVSFEDNPTNSIPLPFKKSESVEEVKNLILQVLLDSSSAELVSQDTEDLVQNEVVNDASENLSINAEDDSKNNLINGISNITLNSKKLNLSRTDEFKQKYPTAERECSVHSCLNQFTAKELMNGSNNVGCVACTERVNKGKQKCVKMVCTESTKQYLISRVPPVLILHFKRFQLDRYSFKKVGERVSFPILLDLSPVTQDPSKPKKYALYGVVEHSGSMSGGHYVAYVKVRAPLEQSDPRWFFLPTKDDFESENVSTLPNSELELNETIDIDSSAVKPPPGQWYYVSDSSVHAVDESKVLERQAYLLFYERIL